MPSIARDFVDKFTCDKLIGDSIYRDGSQLT